MWLSAQQPGANDALLFNTHHASRDTPLTSPATLDRLICNQRYLKITYQGALQVDRDTERQRWAQALERNVLITLTYRLSGISAYSPGSGARRFCLIKTKGHINSASSEDGY